VFLLGCVLDATTISLVCNRLFPLRVKGYDRWRQKDQRYFPESTGSK